MMSRLIMSMVVMAGCLTCVLSAAAASDEELPCVSDWGGPQNNTKAIDDCYKPDKYIDWLTSKVLIIIFPLLLAMGGLLAFPLVFCSRYCCGCCGGYKQRPGDCCGGSPDWDYEAIETVQMQYSNTDRNCARFSPLVLVLLAVVSVGVCISGTTKTVKGIENIPTGVTSGVNYLRGVLTNFIDDTEIPGTGGETVMTLANFSEFVEKLDSAENYINKPSTLDDIRLAKEGAHQLTQSTAAPCIFILLTLLCAMIHIQTCLPCVNACFNFIFLILFGCIACVLLAVNLPLAVLCNEVDAQLERKPGLFQWYYVPQCQVNNTLKTLSNDFDRNLASAADDGCDSIKNFCGQRGSNNSNEIFTCDYSQLADSGGGADTSSCSTFDQVSNFAASMEIKADYVAQCSGITDCSLCVCGDNCTDPNLRSNAHTACGELEKARLLTTSFDKHIKPILSCNVLFDELVKVAKPACNSLPMGVYELGVGYTIIALVALIGIIMNFRGQKRWFKKPDSYVRMMGGGGGNSAPLTVIQPVFFTGPPPPGSVGAPSTSSSPGQQDEQMKVYKEQPPVPIQADAGSYEAAALPSGPSYGSPEGRGWEDTEITGTPSYGYEDYNSSA